MPAASSTPVRQDQEGLMDLGELTEFLRVPDHWVYRRTAKGHPDPLPFVKVGGLLRFRRSEIEAWLDSRRGSWGPSNAA